MYLVGEGSGTGAQLCSRARGGEVGCCARAVDSLCQNLAPHPRIRDAWIKGQVLTGPHTGHVCDFRGVIGHYDRNKKEGNHRRWAANSSTLPAPFQPQHRSLP